METVFIAGSITIKKLKPEFIDKVISVVNSSKLKIVVGDANGSDAAIQEVLKEHGATAVTVYCSGEKPRNNVGAWPVSKVTTEAKPNSRAFFTAKDCEMAKVADYGLMIWDCKSTGTLSNVIELLTANKKTRVFIDKHSRFEKVSNIDDLENLVDFMSTKSRDDANRKISLYSKLMMFNQTSMAVCPSPQTAVVTH